MAKDKEKKWHITPKDGIVRRCNAYIQPCPHGSQMTSHYDNPQEAYEVADKINEMLMKGVDFDKEFKIMNVKGKGRVKGRSEKAVLYDRAMKTAIEQFEEVRKQYSHSIAEQLKANGMKKIMINGEDISGHFTMFEQKTKNYLDEDALKKDENYIDYIKPKKVKESIEKFGRNKKQAGTDQIKEISMTTPTGEITLGFDKDEKGNLIPNEDTAKQLENYVKFHNKIKEMKATREANSKNLMNAMKEADVDNIRLRNMSIKYIPAHYDLEPDRDKIKETFGPDYGKYCKPVTTRTYVQFYAKN